MKTDERSPIGAWRAYGLRPRKSLGQHFLADEVHLRRIVAAADLSKADAVLEIGPGPGNLTRLLAEKAGCVIAVELDDNLIPLLRQTFADAPHVHIVHGDILQLEPAYLLRQCKPSEMPIPYKVVANLPYYITSAVIRHLLEGRHPPSLLVLTVQREVAQRIVARPPEMSLLAVSVQYYAEPRLIARIPPGAFTPPPKVESAIVRLDRRPHPAVAVAPEDFFRVVSAGFGQRRKQLRNSLAAGLGLPSEVATSALEAAHIQPARRAETLTLEEWGALCRALSKRLNDTRPDTPQAASRQASA
jgi:16S rRNA (adenine1518-N6/adenine1519-N6)-dimethyltransferase